MKYRTRISFYSGVVPFPIYTKPTSCGGTCIYCPTAYGIPKSYVPNKDTLAARSLNYSPSHQFQLFLERILKKRSFVALPLEVIILGGSFSFIDSKYRQMFLRELYNAMAFANSDFSNQDPWESSPFRCSVLTVESRPDQITPDECTFLRSLGVSKVEIGVQHLNDDILRYSNRGHNQSDIIRATRILKAEGFKVGYHIMLGLPGSKIDDDLDMVSSGLWSEDYSPDYLKVYPCVLLKAKNLQPKLHRLYEENKWKPLSTESLTYLLEILRKNVPSYVRISRIQRQFADAIIEAGPQIGIRNLLNGNCQCIRCREVGRVQPDGLCPNHS